MSASQCSSSGCESGWTLYLDQSSLPKDEYQDFGGFVGGGYAKVDEEEEDLSMVSDASSGPLHYCEDDEYCFDQLAKKSKNKKTKDHGRSHQYSYLDDTASSLALGKKVTKTESSIDHGQEFSQGFSATHFKGKSAMKKHLGFFQPSYSEKSTSKDQGGSQGRKCK